MGIMRFLNHGVVGRSTSTTSRDNGQGGDGFGATKRGAFRREPKASGGATRRSPSARGETDRSKGVAAHRGAKEKNQEAVSRLLILLRFSQILTPARWRSTAERGS